jgi:hypothetical protein
MITHVSVCRVESYRFDSDEELVWSWLWCWAGLDLIRFAFGSRDGGEVVGHLDVLCKE